MFIRKLRLANASIGKSDDKRFLDLAPNATDNLMVDGCGITLACCEKNRVVA